MEFIMEKVTSADMKKDFGRVMEEVQHTPVTVTRHGRDVATIFSQRRLQEASKKLLGEYFLEKVESGEMDIFEALEQEAIIMNDVEIAREDLAAGRAIEATDSYFDSIQKRVLAKNKSVTK